jgi:predicted nucleotide-binding protein
MKFSKNEALARIQSKIQKVNELKLKGRRSPDFTKWKRDTEVLIQHVFGNDGRHVGDFASITYALRISSSRTSEAEFETAFQKGLDSARATLESMHTEISEYWDDDPEVAEPRPPTPATVPSGKPRVFIGSSSEGVAVAEALQVALDHAAEVTVWTQGVFALSVSTLQSLLTSAPTYDFAILVLTPDDTTTKREVTAHSPRDNVVFELGLFMGCIGSERTFMVRPRKSALQMPSDLAGVTYALYESEREDRNLTAALGAPATQIKNLIAALGRRRA